MWPINSVQITTELSNIKPVEVKEIVLPYVEASFFTIKMGALQKDLQALPWIQKVSIERVWPDTLKISVTEQKAAVRWKETAFISDQATLFDPQQSHVMSLPRLSGNDARYQEVYAAFKRLNAQLAVVGLTIMEFDLSPRSAWSALLSNGMWLYLGQDDIDARLARFIKAMPMLNLETSVPAYADLRYTNGFVLGNNKS